ncbi:hypothetical protein DL98DRAFT_535960 [Cadophora sp. DSE1049]|nr:hypothetical protein DL98DRAFT_535960 [Cadophora sp. DSE1049]
MASSPKTINPPSFPKWVETNWAHDERREEFPFDKNEFNAYVGIADTYHLFEAHEITQIHNSEDEFEPMSWEEFEELVDASDFELRARFRKEPEASKIKMQKICKIHDEQVKVEVKMGEGKDEERAAASQATFVRSPSGQPTPEGETPDAESPGKAQPEKNLSVKGHVDRQAVHDVEAGMDRRATRSSTENKSVDQSERDKRIAAAKKGAATKRKNRLAKQAGSSSQTYQGLGPQSQRNARRTQSTNEYTLPSPSGSSGSHTAVSDNEDAHDEARQKPLPARKQRRITRSSGSLESHHPRTKFRLFHATAQQTIPLTPSLSPLPRMSDSLQTQRLTSNNTISQTAAHPIFSNPPAQEPLARPGSLSHSSQPISNTAASSQIQTDAQRKAQAELRERNRIARFYVHKDTFEMPENFFENDPVVIRSHRIEELNELRDMILRSSPRDGHAC